MGAMVRALGGFEHIPARPILSTMKALTPEQQSLVLSYLQRAVKQGEGERAAKQFHKDPTRLVRAAQKSLYKEIPVSPREFILNEYYMGHVGKDLFPLLQDRFIRILSNDIIREVICAGCIDLDAIVSLSDGSLPTLRETLDQAPEVVTSDDNALQSAKTTPAVHSGTQRVVEVVLSNGVRFKATPDHRVRTWRDGQVTWVPAGELRSTDFVQSQRLAQYTPSGEVDKDQARALGDSPLKGVVPVEIQKAPMESVVAYLRGLYFKHAEFFVQGRRKARIIMNGPSRFLEQLRLVLLRLGIGAIYEKQALVIIDLDDLDVFSRWIGFPETETCAQIRLRIERWRANPRTKVKRTDHHSMPFTFQHLVDAARDNGFWATATTGIRPSRYKKRVDRTFFERWLDTHRHTDMADELRAAYPPEIAYIGVSSVKTVKTEIPVGDIGVPGQNRFFINGICVHNSIGWGKSYGASIAVCYEIYRLLCMKAPQRIFGNAASSSLVYVVLSVSERAAKNVLWSYLTRNLRDSKYFQENKPYREIDGAIHWPEENIYLRVGSSSENSIIGENVIGGIMDEANFMVSARLTKRSRMAGEFDQAKVLYDALERRRTSRFLLEDRSTLGRFYQISSKQFPGDFLEAKIEKGKKKDHVAILDYPQWIPRMTSSRHPYGKRRFYVYLGNAASPSRILGDDVDLAGKVGNIEVEEGCKIQAVPLILKDKYETDLYGAVRDFSGWSVMATNPFIHEAKVWEQCIHNTEIGDLPDRVHPFTFEEPVGASLGTLKPGRFPVVLLDDAGNKFDPSNFYHRKHRANFSRYPAINPHTPRVGHCDLARKRDGAAFALGHFGGYKDVITREIIDGRNFFYVENRPTSIIDVLVRFYAPPAGRIEPAEIRKIIWACVEFGQYQLVKMTYDQYQSNESIDSFLSSGVESYVHSVVRTTRGYELMRQSMVDKRTSYYPHSGLFKDFASLQYNNETGKVDHADQSDDGSPGTKDISDCIAAIHEHIADEYSSSRQPVPMELGEFDDWDDPAEILAEITRRLQHEDDEPSRTPEQIIVDANPIPPELRHFLG